MYGQMVLYDLPCPGGAMSCSQGPQGPGNAMHTDFKPRQGRRCIRCATGCRPSGAGGRMGNPFPGGLRRPATRLCPSGANNRRILRYRIYETLADPLFDFRCCSPLRYRAGDSLGIHLRQWCYATGKTPGPLTNRANLALRGDYQFAHFLSIVRYCLPGIP